MFTATEQNAALQTKNSFAFQPQQPIVVVDDNSDDREILCRSLKSVISVYKPLISLESGAALLDYLAELERENVAAEEFTMEIPDMIFLDLMMPGMNGVEALRHIRGQSIWADIPVTLVTCSRDDAIIKEAEEAGANAFMPKPFAEWDIIQAVHKDSNFSSVL